MVPISRVPVKIALKNKINWVKNVLGIAKLNCSKQNFN